MRCYFIGIIAILSTDKFIRPFLDNFLMFMPDFQ